MEEDLRSDIDHHVLGFYNSRIFLFQTEISRYQKGVPEELEQRSGAPFYISDFNTYQNPTSQNQRT